MTGRGSNRNISYQVPFYCSPVYFQRGFANAGTRDYSQGSASSRHELSMRLVHTLATTTADWLRLGPFGRLKRKTPPILARQSGRAAPVRDSCFVIIFSIITFTFQRFSGLAVVTGVVPSPSRYVPSFFFYCAKGSAFPLLVDFSMNVAVDT